MGSGRVLGGCPGGAVGWSSRYRGTIDGLTHALGCLIKRAGLGTFLGGTTGALLVGVTNLPGPPFA